MTVNEGSVAVAKHIEDPKPCPVCGRKPEVDMCAPWPKDMGSAPWYVGCYDPGHKEHFRGVNGSTKADAIKQWNELPAEAAS